MTSVLRILENHNTASLRGLAQVWGVRGDIDNPEELRAALREVMRDPAVAERVYDSLGDDARQTLQTLVGSKGKMPRPMFEAMFGGIRQMGEKETQKAQPHQKPTSKTEALYFRGLIGVGFENTPQGAQGIVYIPDDLRAVLPLHKTAYDKLEPDELSYAFDDDDDEAPSTIEPLDAAEIDSIRQADTSLVDDMTTLLAYLRLTTPTLEGDSLSLSDADALLPHLLMPDTARIPFMLGVGISAALIEVQGGRVFPTPDARKWLSAPRPEQVRGLAEAWRRSTAYTDLFHVPGLTVEREAGGGTIDRYNPAAARAAILDLLKGLIPAHEWWSVDEFITLVRVRHADFQRPNADFDSWYIRNDEGEYLAGLESWDAVEGALLEFYLFAPLHWLGMLDTAEDSARLTAYGRGFLGMAAYPNPADQAEPIRVSPDGVITATRKTPRYDRYQAARFTDWAGIREGVYTYELNTTGIERAAAQGINTEQIAAFIARASEQPVPQPVTRLLETWRGGAAAQVSIERAFVLRTTAPEILDAIMGNPSTRRYMGARLGEMAALVRVKNDDELNAVREALGKQGVQVDVVG